MSAVLQLLGRAIGLLEQLLGIAQNIQTLLNSNREDSTGWQVQALYDWMSRGPFTYASYSAGIAAAIDQLSAATMAVRVDTATPHAATITDILGAIDQDAQVVKLPVSPPAGYGGGSALDVAEAVWYYKVSQALAGGMTDELFMWEWVIESVRMLSMDGERRGYRSPKTNWYRVAMGDTLEGKSWGYNSNSPSHTPPPDPDFSLVVAGDSVLSFLQRTQPTWTWNAYGPSAYQASGAAFAPLFPGCGWASWVPNFTQAEMYTLAGLLGGSSSGAPLWPGLANVTLGEPLALADGLVVPGPMSGLLFDFTTVPPGIDRYRFSDRTSYVHVGNVTFESDNGYCESAVPYSFAKHIVTPQAIAQPSAAIVRLGKQVTGTVTPWLSA